MKPIVSSRPAVLAAAVLLAGTLSLCAQNAAPVQSPQTSTQVGNTSVTGSTQTSTDAQGRPQASASVTLSNAKPKKRVAKDEKVVQSKDTRKEVKKDKKLDTLAAKDLQLPDKQLYDKALAQQKSGHYDVARLDLNTLLSTYPDSQYQMRAKLAVADRLVPGGRQRRARSG